MLDSTQRSRDLHKGPMGDDEPFPVIEPQWGKSPPPVFTVSYATNDNAILSSSGAGSKGSSTTLPCSSNPIGPENVKKFYCITFSCLVL